MDLKGKLILITGAAQGLGLAMAKRLIEHGAIIAAADINQSQLEATANQLDAPSQYHPFTVNVTDEQSVSQLLETVKQQLGTPDALVNNAGIVRDALLVKHKDGKLIDKMSLATWQSVLDVNLTGVFLMTRESAISMLDAGKPGVIVNISSISSSGNMGQSNYTAAKAGVSALTVTWAKELIRHQIRVAAVAPGFIETDLTKNMKPSALEKMTGMIPSKRLGQPDEIAQVVQLIIENDYINGRVIECDGGLRI